MAPCFGSWRHRRLHRRHLPDRAARRPPCGRRRSDDPRLGQSGCLEHVSHCGETSGCARRRDRRAEGAVPVGVALLVAGRPEAHAVWVAAVAGHVWPVTRRLRGGKGVATAAVDSDLAAHRHRVRPAFFAVVKGAAALGSLSIAIAFPIVSAIAGRPGWEVAVGAGVAASWLFVISRTFDDSGSGRSNGMNVGMQRHRRCMRRIP